jgi:hypothetical protein
MILDSEDVDKRLSSSNNLLNRLRNLTNNGLGVKDFHKIPESDSDKILNIPSLPAVPVELDVTNLPESESESEDEVPSVEALVNRASTKIKLGLAHETALDVLISSAQQLKERIDCYDVDDAKTLSKIAGDMSKVVVGIRNSENKKNEMNIGQQVIIWKPIQQTENHYDHIVVSE